MPIEYRIFFKVLLLPPSLSILIGLAGVLLWRRRPRLAFGLCATSIVSLWLLATPAVSDLLARATESYPAFDPSHLSAAARDAQAIVVLGGGVRPNAPEAGGDAPAVHVDLRLIEAARVVRATHLPVLVSGTGRETLAMRRSLEQVFEIPVRWVEGSSSTTRENALFSARLLKRDGVERIILVTSAVHMPRALADFRAVGLQVSAAPAEMWTHDKSGALAFVPSVGALDRSHLVLYEWAADVVRRL